MGILGLVGGNNRDAVAEEILRPCPLSTNNLYQAGVATVFHLIVITVLEPIRFNITSLLS